nr:elastin-binding protein EbpS [Staphylococcus sp. 191]
MYVSKDNFKDEFEQSRQEIKSHNHDEPSSEIHVDDSEQQTENNQQFPPRNASRRHRKREHGPSPVNDENQADQQIDSSEQETNEKSQKRPGKVGGFVNHQDEHTKAKNDQPIAKDEATEHSTQEAQQNDQSIKDHKAEQTHDQNHTAQTGNHKKSNTKDKAALTGAAAVGGGAIAKHHHNKTTSHHESSESFHSNQDDASSSDKKAQHENKTDKENAVSGAAVGAGASQTHQSSHTGTENSQPAYETHVSNGRSGGGRFKKLLPLLAAIILLGTLAIFGGIYLVNHNQQGDHASHVAQKHETKEHSESDKEKDKSTKDDDKAQSDSQDDNNSADNDNATDDSNASDQNNNSAQDPTDQNQQQYNQSNQQYGQQNGQANNQQAQNNTGHTHTVTGNQNLYRIAIQYYGNGSPENVEKIRRANGIQGNNIRNGQQLIIP